VWGTDRLAQPDGHGTVRVRHGSIGAAIRTDAIIPSIDGLHDSSDGIGFDDPSFRELIDQIALAPSLAFPGTPHDSPCYVVVVVVVVVVDVVVDVTVVVGSNCSKTVFWGDTIAAQKEERQEYPTKGVLADAVGSRR